MVCNKNSFFLPPSLNLLSQTEQLNKVLNKIELEGATTLKLW